MPLDIFPLSAYIEVGRKPLNDILGSEGEIMDPKSARPIKILMRGELVDRIDLALQAGIGGFRTRHKLIEEAVEYYLHELEAASDEYIGDTEEERPSKNVRDTSSAATSATESREPDRSSEAKKDAPPETDPPCLIALQENPSWADYVREYDRLEDMEVSVSAAHSTIELAIDVAERAQGPLLGFHNRDWPSIEALGLLAAMTKEGPVPLVDYFTAATANAWKLADRLAQIEDKKTGKLTALLPSNRSKAKAAENNYQSFAIGWVPRATAGEKVHASGPLFSWSCIGLVWSGDQLHTGLTEAGVHLLKAMHGLTPLMPHGEDKALAFLDFLREHATDDWSCLALVLRIVEQGPTRADLLVAIREAEFAKEWTESMSATAAQGYIARGREWGLVEPSQAGGRYHLTELGQTLLADTEVTAMAEGRDR